MTAICSRCLAISLLLPLLFVSGCSQYAVRHNIQKMMHHKVTFPTELELGPMTGRPKLVFHYMPSDCATCKISVLPHYSEFFASINSEVDIVILFSTTEMSYERVADAVALYDIDFPIYFDRNDCFGRMNTFIPAQAMYHTFLLDKDNRIVFIGDPLVNNKLMALFRKSLAGIAVRSDVSCFLQP